MSSNQAKYLKYPGNLDITYFTKSRGSFVGFMKESVYFDKMGYFDSLTISWYGKMAKQRIADWLPYEYLVK